jgi:hypothetical protein
VAAEASARHAPWAPTPIDATIRLVWTPNGRSHAVEDRPYEANDTSAADRDALEDCVWLLEPGMIYLYETPQPTAFSISVLANKLSRVRTGMGPHVMVVDLTRAKPPSAKIRELLRAFFTDDRLRYVMVCTEKNSVINLVAKLVLSYIIESRFDIVATREEAITRARAARA